MLLLLPTSALLLDLSCSLPCRTFECRWAAMVGLAAGQRTTRKEANNTVCGSALFSTACTASAATAPNNMMTAMMTASPFPSPAPAAFWGFCHMWFKQGDS